MVADQLETEIRRPRVGDPMRLDEIQPVERIGENQLGLNLHLLTSQIGIFEVIGQNRNDVVHGEPVEGDVVWGIAIELL